MPTKALTKASDKETDLATAVAALNDREIKAYRHFVNSGQKPIAEDKAEELFKLYQRGQTTLEIARLFPQYSHSQVVASRVMAAWDDRKATEVKNLQVEVPAKVESTTLETQEFLSNLLHASHRKFNDALKKYIATGDVKVLEEVGVPLPSSLKELSALIDMYMKISGTDTKKVDVRVAGGVVHQHTKVKPEEAEALMDDLLGDQPAQDAEFTEVKDEPKRLAAPTSKTPEEMIEYLVKGGMPQARAEQVVRQLKAKAESLGSDVADIIQEYADGNKDPVN